MKKNWSIFVTGFLVLMVSYQNCGQQKPLHIPESSEKGDLSSLNQNSFSDSFDAQSGGYNYYDNTSSGGFELVQLSQFVPIYTSTPLTDFVAEKSFTLMIGEGQYSQSTVFVWDHNFNNGSSFCEQTVAEDRRSVTYTCPEEGRLVVNLTVIHSDSSEEPYVVQITVGQKLSFAENSEEEEEETPGGNTNLGMMIYTQSCASCHGEAANTTKKSRSAEQITAAIANIPVMSSLSNLSAEQIMDIASFLNQ